MLTNTLLMYKISRGLLYFLVIISSFVAVSFQVVFAKKTNEKKLRREVLISDITITGNKRVETELIELNISSKIGEEYSEESVKEDIKNIYRLGFFDNVSVEIEKSDTGVNVFYIVNEKPVVIDLRISGNDDINDEDIQEVIKFDEGEIINLKKVDSTLDAIKNLYAQRGLVGTEVEYEIEPEGDGTVSVTFDIVEGKTAYIKRVTFSGNDNIKGKYLEKRIYSKPKGFLSFLTKKGLYNVDEIENDSERIRAAYLDNGYLDAKVDKPESKYIEDKEGYEVIFRIEEGNKYTIEYIGFIGDLIDSEEKLLSIVDLKQGEVFSSSILSSDIAKLTTFYGDQGYAFANVNPKFSVDRENLLVSINYEFEKGNQIYIRNIDFLGNERTRDKVIRREIPIEEQELFNASKVQSIRSKVSRLGYFENVEAVTNRVADHDDLLDVDVRVKEKPTGFFSVAGGFSSVETVIFAGQIQESNLFGYGKSLSLNAQIGGVTKVLSVNYQDLHFFETDWTFNVTAFFNDQEFRDFDRRAYGLNFGFGRWIYKNLRARMAYRIEKVDIDNVDRDARLIITESKRTISSFSTGLVWDSRDNLIDPRKGLLARTNIEYAGPFGGDTDFIKYTLSSRYWFPFWRDTFFALHSLYGIIDLMDTGDDLVVGERFFLGGPNSLRGFAFRRVGPRVPTEDGDFVIIGGVQQLLFQADYVFPIFPDAGLRGVLFFDIGNAFNDGEDLTINPSDLKKDVGLGLRWLSPLGPLRLEVGFPLGDRLPGEDSFEIQFTVGSLF